MAESYLELAEPEPHRTPCRKAGRLRRKPPGAFRAKAAHRAERQKTTPTVQLYPWAVCWTYLPFGALRQAHVHHRTQQQPLHWGKLAALGSLDFTIGLHSGVRMSSSHLVANESRATPPTLHLMSRLSGGMPEKTVQREQRIREAISEGI